MMPTPSARLEAQLPGHPANQAIRRLACRETLDKLGFDRAEPGCVDYPLLACHPSEAGFAPVRWRGAGTAAISNQKSHIHLTRPHQDFGARC